MIAEGCLPGLTANPSIFEEQVVVLRVDRAPISG
jgi:hypothetical protein